MMNLLRVRAENFCQYRELNETLHPGLTCLLGINGSGKSNMVRAIYLCLVGEVYGAPNLVRDGMQKGFVALDVQTPQGELTITRYLKHNPKTRGTTIKHELTASWIEAPLTKKTDVADFLAPLIGVPIPTLQHISFALQGEFDKLMFCDHMVRARMISTLMGMDRAEKLRGVLKDSLDTIADMPDRTEQIAHTTAELQQYQQELVSMQQRLQAAEAQVTPAIEASYRNALKIQGLPKAEDRDVQLAAAELQEATARANVQAEKTKLANLPEQTAAAPDDIGHSNYQQWLQAKNAMQLHEDSAAAFAKQPIPAGPAAADLEQLAPATMEQLHALQGEIAKLDGQVQWFGSGVCPTCKRPLEADFDINEVTADLAAKQEEAGALRTAIDTARDNVAAAKNEVELWERDRKMLTGTVAEAQARLLPLQGYAAFDLEAYQAAKTQYTAALTAQKERGLCQQNLATAELLLERATGEIRRLKDLQVVSQAELQQADMLTQAYDAVQEDIRARARELDQCSARLTGCEKRLELLAEDMQKGAVNRSVKELLQFARDQLHTEKLPRLAARSSIQAINQAMRKYLDMFAFPYGFRLDENLDFVMDLDSSEGHPAEILSGGERVRAAVAMRFALMDVFSAGCGILIIDEPTTALDDDAVNALIEVLGTAAAYFKKRNVKILCPTHAPQLAAVADTTIAVGE